MPRGCGGLEAGHAFGRRQKRIRPATERTAYERATVVCPAEECRHTLTLRKSAIAKTRFLCVEHGEEMSA